METFLELNHRSREGQLQRVRQCCSVSLDIWELIFSRGACERSARSVLTAQGASLCRLDVSVRADNWIRSLRLKNAMPLLMVISQMRKQKTCIRAVHC